MLGLDRGASPEDAELAYHHLLRLHHPDLHQHDDADVIAAADERTRVLNAAIGQIRRGDTGGAPPERETSNGVACPMCGRAYFRREDLQAHVREAHAHLDPNPVPRARRRRRRAPRWLRRWDFVPLWVLLAFNVLAASLLATAIAPVAHGFSYYVFALAMAPTFMRLINSGPRDL